ncbi:MAG: 50S ribosomal protein L33 [Minisyncoccales bacterium]
MASKKRKKFIKLVCSQCKEINYFTKKSKRTMSLGKKIELKKFCKKCKKHTLHQEGKK